MVVQSTVQVKSVLSQALSSGVQHEVEQCPSPEPEAQNVISQTLESFPPWLGNIQQQRKTQQGQEGLLPALVKA